jgi:hypothetical protein
MRNDRARLVLLAAATFAGGVAAAHDIDIQVAPADPSRAEIKRMITKGRRDVETFFHLRFPEVIHVKVASSRSNFNDAFPAAWGMDKTECWMVGVGVADFLVLLSPSTWMLHACEHDAKDSNEVQRIVTHELVHVFHGQRNPSRDFTGAEDIGWFIEGLAVLASGQLDAARLSKTADAVRAGEVPKSLNATWSGPHRYGRAGSMVQYLDVKYGRQVLIALLPLVKQSELLARLDVTEAQLLDDWKAWLLATSPPAAH